MAMFKKFAEISGYAGPLYGFRYIFLESVRLSIDVPSLMPITSPLGLFSCFADYWYGDKTARLKVVRSLSNT
ncbi:hypothetical protein CSC2_23230 [Clostridium zeae]|uniref:Uncharacterized protein n=1 Tax=Clostridium zeae TaxID=2759022 RepID=A0ABQ1EAI6_9CLOT|nr:hypothetical protein [Clostridium zeae]GFZ31797.1 hypothetical protein CSC2_23230 [Clostridium zeae]